MVIEIYLPKKIGAIILTTFVLAGCSSQLGSRDSFFSFGKSSDKRLEELGKINAQEAVNFLSEPATTLLETSETNALRLTTDVGDKVPNIVVGRINATPMPFGAVLNKIAEQSDMSWKILDDKENTLMNRNVNIVRRKETSLKSVLDSLSSMTESFYHVKGDQITFSKEKSFVLRVPRMADSQDVLKEGLINLGAEKVFTDKLSGTISFNATKSVYSNVKRLVESFEQGRDMVVYDVWIIDRSIGEDAGVGVSANFKDKSSKERTTTATQTDPNTGLPLTGESTETIESENGVTAAGAGIISAILEGHSIDGFTTGTIGKMSVRVAASFLRSLGSAETVAKPTISMLSGGESEFRSGSTREYIREVSENGDDDTGYTSGTDTQKLETGIKIKVSGSHHGGVISTDFEIEVDEFVGFEEFDTGDIVLRLPETTEREMTAHLEARPGDVMILGGIIRNKENLNGTEMVGLGLPISRSRSTSKSETILLVRPRLVQIRPVGQHGKAKTTYVEEGIGMVRAKNPMEEVLKDEEKARNLLDKLFK